MNIVQLIFMVFVVVTTLFLGGCTQNAEYPLDHIDVDATDKDSLQRGARNFVNTCMACHSLKYQRHERVADDLGIPHDLMMQHLAFNRFAKIGDLMTSSIDPKDAKRWFGVEPPDLTLVTRVRSSDWLYTYLRSFYKDPKRPYGVNNKVFPDVGMPHVLMRLQGVQIDSCQDQKNVTMRDPLTGEKLCGLEIDSKHKGEMSPKDYDQFVYDLVNFLAYSAEPMKQERKDLGVYILLFLLLFGVFAYLLKREYWKDVH